MKEIEIKEASLKNQNKSREKTEREVDTLRRSVAAKESEINAMEERHYTDYSTKLLEELKERESELRRQNEEDQAVIQGENTTPSAREAAEARVAETNEELAPLQT